MNVKPVIQKPKQPRRSVFQRLIEGEKLGNINLKNLDNTEEEIICQPNQVVDQEKQSETIKQQMTPGEVCKIQNCPADVAQTEVSQLALTETTPTLKQPTVQ